MKADKTKIVTSIFWKLMERGGTQIIQFIIQIILARLLLPEQYGVIAIVTVFISFSVIFVQSGFGSALIQAKEADQIAFSSVFFLNLLIAIILYGLLFFLAPFIAQFYNESELTAVLRVLSLNLIFGAVYSVQNAYISRQMIFRKLFFSSVGAVVVSGIAGVVTAFMGWGVWALVLQQLVNQIVIVIILWFTVNWRPSLVFSFDCIKKLFSFGWKLLVSALLNTASENLSTLVIGKKYSSDVLGVFNRGKQFPALLTTNINSSIQAVLFPAFATHQEDPIQIRKMMKSTISGTTFIFFPMMVGLAVVAKPLILLLLTEKWVAAVPFLQIACAGEMLIPIHTTNLQAINALGRSDIFLKLEVIKTIIALAILGISIPMGIYAIAWGFFIGGFIALFINAYPNQKLLKYRIIDQLFDIIPALLLSILMGVIIYPIKCFNLAPIQLLLIQVSVGIVVYIGLARVFRIKSLDYIITVLKDFFVKKNGF